MCPSRTCSWCSKGVVEAVHCADCKARYHPGCLKLKSHRPGCSTCCRNTYSRYTLSQPVLPTVIDVPPLTPSPLPTTSAAGVPGFLSPPAVSPSLVGLFQDMIRRMDLIFDDVQGRFDEIDSRLSCLPVMQAQIEANTTRIQDLERQNTAYAEDLRELRAAIAELRQHRATGQQELLRASARLCETELIFSGVPCPSSGAIPAVISQVASTLGTALVDGDVLATRFLVSRSRARRNTRESPLPIVARFRSRELCLRLLAAKKARGILRTSDLDPQPSCPSSVIHVNECLPSDFYKLLVATRIAAKARGFKYVWHNAGVVLVKLRDGEPTRCIRSSEDLETFEAEPEPPAASPSDADLDKSMRPGPPGSVP